METMLALLPPGADDSILFKTLYVTKLPREVYGMHLDSREMADLADDHWCSLNEHHSGAKAHHVAGAIPEDSDKLEEAVAAFNMQPKRIQLKKKKASSPSKPPGKLCRSHEKYGDQTGSVRTPAPACGRKKSRPSSCRSSRRPQGRPQLSSLPGGRGQLQAIPGGLWQCLQHPPTQVFS